MYVSFLPSFLPRTAAGWASDLTPDHIPEGFVAHLVDLAPEIPSSLATAALQELSRQQPQLWQTWSTCGNSRAIPHALRPSLDRILRRFDGDRTPARHWVPHTDADIAIASLPGNYMLAAGCDALRMDILGADDADAEAPLDSILNDWAASLPGFYLDRHRTHGVPLTESYAF